LTLIETEEMEPPPIIYDTTQYIATATGNIISRQSKLNGVDKIRLSGKCILEEGVIINGEQTDITLGRYSSVGKNTTISPSPKLFKGEMTYFPLRIGDHVRIGSNCVVKALTIGSNVEIEDDCVIDANCVLSDCCVVKKGSILAPGTVVPPYTIASGQPARVNEELIESFKQYQQIKTMGFYQCWTLKKS
jgi:dynactin-5